MTDGSILREDSRSSRSRGRRALRTLCAIAQATLWTAVVACGVPGSVKGEAGEGVLLGVFHEGAQADLKPVKELEAKAGKKFASVMWYADWTSPFPADEARRVSRAGYMPHITWEPWSWEKKDLVKLQDIVEGKWDDYLEGWARGAARFGRPLLLRWGHEFNGDWYPWSVPNNGKDPALYVRAYRRVHDAFAKAGAKNVKWIWCFNAASVPALPWNAPMDAYPGDGYVDWVGIDGYNFSGTDSFRSIFKNAYAKALATADKPIMIAEFATGGPGADKSRWIAQMANDLGSAFPAIRAITWFDIDKERDWRLLSGLEAEKTVRSVFARPYFLSDPAIFETVARSYPALRGTYLEILKAQTPKKILKEARAAAFASGTDLTGARSAWKASEPISLTSVKGSGDMDARVRLGYSPEALFVRAEVGDDVAMNNDKAGADIWNGDCVELCVSMDKDADPEREFYGLKDVQVGISPGKPDRGIRPSVWAWGAVQKVPAGATVKAEKTASGYLVEARIPWDSLSPGFVPAKGMALGFDLAVDDADAKGPDREGQSVWSGDGNFYANPSQWGSIVLD